MRLFEHNHEIQKTGCKRLRKQEGEASVQGEKSTRIQDSL